MCRSIGDDVLHKHSAGFLHLALLMLGLATSLLGVGLSCASYSFQQRPWPLPIRNQ